MTDKPVVMVVTATITDPLAYGRYMQALVASGLFARHGGQPRLTGAAREMLEGDERPGDITAVIDFPSAEAAKAFWHGDEYRAIARLREGAGEFRVGLWRRLPPV